jgi:hypothetical protein
MVSAKHKGDFMDVSSRMNANFAYKLELNTNKTNMTREEAKAYVRQPENVKLDDLSQTVLGVSDKLPECLVNSQDANFRGQIINAAKIWWNKAEKIENDSVREKVYKKCANLILNSDKFRTSKEAPSQFVTFHFKDGVTMELNPLYVDLLKVASPAINVAFAHEYDPNVSKTKTVKLSNIKSDILQQIIVMLQKPRTTLPNEINILELFDAVRELGVTSLQQQIGGLLKNYLNTMEAKNIADVLKIYVYVQEPPSKETEELSNLCVDKLIQYYPQIIEAVEEDQLQEMAPDDVKKALENIEEVMKTTHYKKLSPESLIILAKQKGESLTQLNLVQRAWDPEQIKQVLDFCPHIKSLTVSMRNLGLIPLDAKVKIEELRIDDQGYNIKEAAIDYSPFLALKNLSLISRRSVTLDNRTRGTREESAFNDDLLEKIAKIQNLQSLSIDNWGNNDFTEDGIDKLKACKSLTSISLNQLTTITQDSIKRLLPQIEHIKAIAKPPPKSLEH